jgi:hypothetical protein
LKRIPDEFVFQFKGQLSYNSQVTGNDQFLSYNGGGLSFWGNDDGDRDIQYQNLGSEWDGAAGVSRTDAPIDSKWSMTVGGKHQLSEELKIGGYLSSFYERDSFVLRRRHRRLALGAVSRRAHDARVFGWSAGAGLVQDVALRRPARRAIREMGSAWRPRNGDRASPGRRDVLVHASG